MGEMGEKGRDFLFPFPFYMTSQESSCSKLGQFGVCQQMVLDVNQIVNLLFSNVIAFSFHYFLFNIIKRGRVSAVLIV